MRQQITKIVCSISILLFVFLPLSVSSAAEATNYSITIVKYKLTDATQLANPLPIDGTKAEQVVDVNGNALKPFEGVQYNIVRVTPKTGGTGFEVVEGIEAFETTITTNGEGNATVSSLQKGMYRITELAHDSIKEVMEPVVLELPLPQANGGSLEQVYIYPKSNIMSGTTPKKPDKPITRIPQTSGTLGTYYALVGLLGLVIFMGTWGISLITKKQHSL